MSTPFPHSQYYGPELSIQSEELWEILEMSYVLEMSRRGLL